MTNEELVELIQGGERELLPELWAQVERFVAQQARHRLVLSGGLGGGGVWGPVRRRASRPAFGGGQLCPRRREALHQLAGFETERRFC